MKMSTWMAVSSRRESKLVSENIPVLTLKSQNWDLVLTGTTVLKRSQFREYPAE